MKAFFLTTLIFLNANVYGVRSELSTRHRESKGIGYNKGYSTLDYSLTAQKDLIEFIFNLKGHLFNDGKAAGNTGLGVRYSLKDDSSRIGANIFYDFRDNSHFFTQQLGGGLEWISPMVDVRFNGYFPIGKQRSFQTYKFQNFSGNQILTKRKFNSSLSSLEGEIGTEIAPPFYFAIGSYYLFRETNHSIHVGKAWGGKARFDLNLGQYFKLGALATYDSIFKTCLQGYVSINIPLGAPKTACHKGRNLRDVPIIRNEIIPIQARKDSKTPLAFDNRDICPKFLFVNNQASPLGNGTFEYPFSSLKEAEEYSKPGNVIYVYPGDGTPNGMDEGIVLKEDQILVSSGSSLELDAFVIPPQTTGEYPTITNIHIDQPIITNPGQSNLDSFHFIDPLEYLRNYDFQSYPIEANHPAPTPSIWNDPQLLEWVDLKK